MFTVPHERVFECVYVCVCVCVIYDACMFKLAEKIPGGIGGEEEEGWNKS